MENSGWKLNLCCPRKPGLGGLSLPLKMKWEVSQSELSQLDLGEPCGYQKRTFFSDFLSDSHAYLDPSFARLTNKNVPFDLSLSCF